MWLDHITPKQFGVVMTPMNDSLELHEIQVTELNLYNYHRPPPLRRVANAPQQRIA